MAGKIITLEGLDGSGKSTQIDLLLNYFKTKGIKYQYVHFPMLNQGRYGQLIAEYLRGEFGAIDQVHPKLVALLFAEDRHAFKPQLMKWLNDGYLILLDRYVNSNIAFQCAKTPNVAEKKALKSWILDFEFNDILLPKPDKSVFLNVPFHIVEKSLAAERTGGDRDYLNGKTDIHEDAIEFQRQVYQEYLQMIEEQEQFFAVDCMADNGEWLAKDLIHQKLLKLFDL